tara:strand:+ start:199 stop:756 length:558 start_codon:yes stop_codon:yes gene_type:complete
MPNLENDWWLGKRMPDGGFYFYDRHQQLEVLFTKAWKDELPKDPEEYWNIVSAVWQRTEFPRNQVEAWHDIFNVNPGPNKATQEWLKNPKMLYRGYQDDLPDYDWSWTTDKEKAEWFANRFKASNTFDQKGKVKSFDPVDNRWFFDRVMCVMEGDEKEVLLWSHIASQRVNCADHNEFIEEYSYA